MPKRDLNEMGANLTASIQKEKTTFEERFKAADAVLTPEPTKRTTARSEPTPRRSAPLPPTDAATTGGQVRRETFSMLDSDLKTIERLQVRMGKTGAILNKSEIVRIALQTLDDLSDLELPPRAASLARLRRGRKTA